MDPPPRQPAPSPSPFPRLEVLDRSAAHTFARPAKLINDGPDVAHFLTSKAYRDIGTFVMQLNRALCPRSKTQPTDSAGIESFTLGAGRERDPEPVARLRQLLQRVEAFVDEAPPDPGPRRFGNVSFRTWHTLLDQRADALLREFLPRRVLEFPSTSAGAIAAELRAGEEGGEEQGEAGPLDEVKAYFLGSFGSAQRLDYGTGHELSFLAFLGCLWKLGAFESEAADSERALEDVERSIVLGVMEPYLQVIRRLILTYTLEPAGSHGVWGLDDHSFLPYIFGSAQLTRPIGEGSGEAMPLEGSLPAAPRPADVAKADAAFDRLRRDNMYFSAVGFIRDVKTGPFWEHSPILFDVSGIRDGWGKINKGMVKMFNAEVLSKFPVVQHFRFGALFSWDQDPDAPAPAQSVHMANQPASAIATPPAAAPPPVAAAAGAAGIAAPWAQATRMPPGTGGGPGIPYSKAPWASRGVGGGAGGSSAVPPLPRGGPPDTGPLPPTSFPKGVPGKANNQFAVTKAPWAKD
ncbi:Phosphotyrosyl phosphate activator protein-domain-containing protein [Lasiosphaeria ovina]|uniref:Serine/threonine-protein phosphatase 2A activator n=1 Tax=Lasiosphaeria ovina TaxID=92902 RepID=A0AAE0NMD6_9PEZI|nr:Phosphotyrosyl phosphate activator protein-domain-containing protein [Lasiosphaeria ovina]